MLKKCVRWRTLTLFLLGIILALNFIIFVTLPSNRQNEVYSEQAGVVGRQRYDSRGISHLQFPRKRLNKSNFTSESLGADGGAVGGGGGGAWEEGVGEHPPLHLPDQGARFDSKGRGSYRGGDSPRERLEEPQKQQKKTKSPDDQKTIKEGSGSASRGNFTDPQVDAFLVKLEKKGLLDVLPGVGLQENYWMFLKRQRRRRKAGIQLPAFRNYKS